MRKLNYAIFLLAGLLVSTSHAAWQQDVTLCLNVNNSSEAHFLAAFIRNDPIDKWHYVQLLNGQDCVKYSYDHLRTGDFKVQIASGPTFRNLVKFYPDDSCSYLNKIYDSWYQSKNIPTSDHHEFWTFNLTQRAGKEGDKFTYNLSCQHWATN